MIDDVFWEMPFQIPDKKEVFQLFTKVTCLTICLSFAQTVCGEEHVLVENKKSPYRIVIGVEATMQENYAAGLLQQYVGEMTGYQLPIVPDDGRRVDTEIIVGFNRHFDQLGLDVTKESFGPEEFLIKPVGRTLVIVGGMPRGVQYGVNSLLTDTWGCRWFTPLLKRIPKHERLTLPRTARRYEPHFEWRNAFFWSSLDSEWAFHNYQHNRFTALRPEQGWNGALASDVAHTAHTLLPPAKYLKDHPDWFWIGKGNENRSNAWARDKGWVGFCLTNPEVTKTAAQNLLTQSDTRNRSDQFFVISAMDNGDWCECDNCRAWHQREKGGGLSGDSGNWPHGALWLDFAARIHEQVKDKPGAPKIMMLAYGYTPVPPAKPAGHQDLGVLYAEIVTDQFSPLDSKSNATFQNRLVGWQRSVGTAYVWLYEVNFDNWSLVHPNMHTFAESFRYLRKTGVKGVFAQGNQMAIWGQRFGGEMNELRAYLLARLLWNPDLDWRQERRDFCAAYYGEKAGAVIEQYLDDVRKAFVEQDVRTTSGVPIDSFKWITPEMFARWHATMDKAETLAEDDDHRKLIRISRLPIQFTEASIVEDQAKRKVMFQAYLDNARSLGAAQIIFENRHYNEWAQEMGLKLR
jgi:Domain of unknown function (DUF4838)